MKGYLIFDLKVTEFRYPIELSNAMETDILSGLSSNVPKEIVVGPVSLTIRSTKSYWGDVSEDYTEIITMATIYNENLIPVPITKIHYLVEMNNIRLSEGSSNVATVIQPKSEATFVTRLDNRMLDECWVSHIKNGERRKVKIALQPVIEIGNREFMFTLAEKESVFVTKLLG